MMRDKIMARSGEDRFVMGAQMSESARETVKASLPSGLSKMEQRRELFRRLYGDEFRDDQIADLISGNHGEDN